MEKVNELRNKWLSGDAMALSLITGFTPDYIRRVLRGKRHNAKIVIAAKQLMRSRDISAAKFANSNYKTEHNYSN